MYPRACLISNLRQGDVYARRVKGKQHLQSVVVLTAPQLRFAEFGPNFVLAILENERVIHIESNDESVWLMGRVDESPT